MRQLIIEFDENEIEPFFAEEAIRQFELPWAKRVYVEE
jgi:hypothetical protein